jgi:hypothetical protein
MLTEIHNWTAKTDDLKYFNIPAVQCIIQFFYQKMVKYEFSPINFTTQLLDLFQVLLQIGIMNNLIYRVTEYDCDEDNLAPGETCDWDDGSLHSYSQLVFKSEDWDVLLQIFQLILAFIQFYLIFVRLRNFYW